MKLVKGPEAERVTGGLWRQFLISEIAGEIMLGEVQDHLYVEDLDFKGRSKDKVVRDAVETGFLDLSDCIQPGDYRERTKCRVEYDLSLIHI